MAHDSDSKLARALVHDMVALLSAATDPEVISLQPRLMMVERLLSGHASEEDRREVYEGVHPGVRSLYLEG